LHSVFILEARIVLILGRWSLLAIFNERRRDELTLTPLVNSPILAHTATMPGRISIIMDNLGLAVSTFVVANSEAVKLHNR